MLKVTNDLAEDRRNWVSPQPACLQGSPVLHLGARLLFCQLLPVGRGGPPVSPRRVGGPLSLPVRESGGPLQPRVPVNTLPPSSLYLWPAYRAEGPSRWHLMNPRTSLHIWVPERKKLATLQSPRVFGSQRQNPSTALSLVPANWASGTKLDQKDLVIRPTQGASLATQW